MQYMDGLVPPSVTNAHGELHQFCLGKPSCMSAYQDSTPVLGLVLIFLLGMVLFL